MSMGERECIKKGFLNIGQRMHEKISTQNGGENGLLNMGERSIWREEWGRVVHEKSIDFSGEAYQWGRNSIDEELFLRDLDFIDEEDLKR